MAEYDGRGRARSGVNPLSDFDAFRARRVAEQEANGSYEPTVPVYEYESDYGRDYGYEYGYQDPGPPSAVEPTRLVAGDPGQPPGGRGRLRSTAVLLAVALFAVGLGAGVYAATRPTNARPTAAASATGPGMSAGASASANANGGGGAGSGMQASMSPSPDMSTDAGMGSGMDPMATATPDMSQPSTSGSARGTLAELAVLDVAGDSFVALTVRGVAVTIRITGSTQFGTQAQPFSPSDLVPGTQVLARVRRASNGEYVATVITGMDPTSQPSAETSPTSDPSTAD